MLPAKPKAMSIITQYVWFVYTL